MKRITALFLPLFLGTLPLQAETKPPLRALLVAGGCCHDYAGQQKVLSAGIQARANVRVDVWWTDDKSVNPPLSLYDKPDWAKGYDIIIHDECAAGNKDLAVLKRVLDVHQKIPAVHLHCAMHSFRTGTDGWFKHLGLQSASHGPQEPIAIQFVDPEHPITKTLKDWTTIKEELYNNVNVFDAHPLAMGKQMVKRDGKDVEVAAIVAWTNEKQGARSFSTTIGHNTATVEDGRYLDLVTRGLLWACDKLNDDFLGKAYTGENTVTFVKASDQPAPQAAALPAAPKDATLVKVTASSEETGKNNLVWHAVDGRKDTRWCANGGSVPQWLQMEFDKPQSLTGAKVVWERGDNSAYAHQIAGSADGKAWATLSDATKDAPAGDTTASFDAKDVRFLKITVTGCSSGGWASIREITVQGPGLKSIYPKLDPKQVAAATDQNAKQGNVTPKIVKLTPQEEADILKDVKVPDGFDVTLFAPSATANYPVYVASAPNGDLYVSSDGNGSLGRDPHRGRVLRLRDADRDGRADQVTEFVKDVDSPRGLVWDHDRLYLLHPPHVTVFFDKDGDGVAEDSKKLIDGIAFDFSGRPADHTTNGLDLGIDGWLYVAGGDFGFVKATGTDGRTLQHRGGGVIRFRPDGSGLELFATGTRNILGTPISPLLDIFARDNTNDGGGWNVRFHHFTGLEDHGYPRLYKNFGDEHVQPLADYGGGSGCGSTYLSEPGFPDEWNHAPLTCDWGSGALWRHTVEPRGGTFAEITTPQPFIKMTRPTDASVDGLSGVYQASWKGATFNWAGPDVGYIVRVSPKGYQPEPLPDFDKLDDAALVKLLESPSQVRVLAAQRALVRRAEKPETNAALAELAEDAGKSLESRVAGLYAIALRGGSVTKLTADATLQRFALRALGDQSAATGEPFIAGLKSDDPRVKIEAIVGAARRGLMEVASAIAGMLGDPDPTVAHTSFRALALMKAHAACFAVFDDPQASAAQRRGAALAIMRIHDPVVIDGLIARLETEKRPAARRDLLAALSRLHSIEGEWKGDSWGTRPDTRGPYYQPEPWAGTEKVAAALKSLLAKADAAEAGFLVGEINRNRIQSSEALDRVITLAASDDSLLAAAVTQIAGADSVPAAGIPILLKAARKTDADAATLARAVEALAKTDDKEALPAMLSALTVLDGARDANKEQESARNAFLNAPKLENHHLALETSAGDRASPAAIWADAGLIALSDRKSGSPESRELSRKAIDAAWQTPARRAGLIRAAAKIKSNALNARILVALADPDQSVAKAANDAAKTLKLDQNQSDKTPKIGTLAVDKAVAEVLKAKGDKALGEQIFQRATCVACHTTSESQPPKGPYLGNIAQTYKRPDLALNILDPNKTIAQGFASNVFTKKDGTVLMGFVTDESGDQVKLRDIAAQEHAIKKSDIAKRDTLPTSMMPPGLMNAFSVREVASLLDYLESLVKK
jgi:putative membrane-bound dehydrogenase-like protein